MQLVEGAEARVKSSFGSRGSPGSDATSQGNECGIPEDHDGDREHKAPVSTVVGGRFDTRWNTLAPVDGASQKPGGFGPVIFRVSQVISAMEGHVLTKTYPNPAKRLRVKNESWTL